MKKNWSEWIWDAWCILSVIGIWPRYIEPRLLCVNHFNLNIPDLSQELVNLKILHFSDLHWNRSFLPSFQKKLIFKINDLKPDIILFTGDFICRSKLEKAEELKNILKSLKAKIGCFAILGNHDYSHFLTVNDKGDYDVETLSKESTIIKGFKRLFHQVNLTKQITPQARQVKPHEDLVNLLKQTPFQLLHNTTYLIPYQNSWINICGLGEYSAGQCNVNQAFKHYDLRYLGIILSHNPDTIEILKDYPGEIILSGHTHGGQVNLPGFWQRFTRIENLQYKQGLKRIGKKWAYINRGISSIIKFRWFALPELTLFTLKKERHEKK